MIEYLNANQGFVMALLTAVYVVATVVLVVVAQRQARLTRLALDLASRAEQAKYRPYIVFDIVYEKVVAYARLRNTGASPARNVQVTIARKLNWKDKEHGVGFVEKGVSFLAPGRELSEPFAWAEDFFQRYSDLQFTGTVTYRDSDDRGYSEAFLIDLGYLRGMTSIGEIDIGRQLEAIKKALERFHSGSFKPLVRTIDEHEFQEQERAQFEAGQQILKELENAKNAPNKAPEPTPGAVTPRATEGEAK